MSSHASPALVAQWRRGLKCGRGSMHGRSASIHGSRPACRLRQHPRAGAAFNVACGYRIQLRYARSSSTKFLRAQRTTSCWCVPPLTALHVQHRFRAGSVRAPQRLPCPVVLLLCLPEGSLVVGRQGTCQVGVDVPDEEADARFVSAIASGAPHARVLHVLEYTHFVHTCVETGLVVTLSWACSSLAGYPQSQR
jgi:hypothetical protein